MEVDHNFKIFYSQEDLNEIYLGPPFRLNYRYTQLLVNFYICWMYAISMPILPLIGAISFFCSYWVGKHFIVDAQVSRISKYKHCGSLCNRLCIFIR